MNPEEAAFRAIGAPGAGRVEDARPGGPGCRVSEPVPDRVDAHCQVAGAEQQKGPREVTGARASPRAAADRPILVARITHE